MSADTGGAAASAHPRFNAEPSANGKRAPRVSGIEWGAEYHGPTGGGATYEISNPADESRMASLRVVPERHAQRLQRLQDRQVTQSEKRPEPGVAGQHGVECEGHRQEHSCDRCGIPFPHG